MKNIIIKTDTVTKLDIINAESSHRFADMPDGTKAKGFAICEEDGKRFAYIFADDGTVYAGNSNAISRAVENLIDLYADAEGDCESLCVSLKVNHGTSAAGKEFLTLQATPLEG